MQSRAKHVPHRHNVTQIGVYFIDGIIFAFLRVIYTIKERVLMQNLLLVINAMFVKTI